MTPELQRAKARYEEARFQYRKAVLASLNGAANGQAIQQAIRAFQSARRDLEQLETPPAVAGPGPRQPQVAPASTCGDRRASGSHPDAWGFVLRLLKAS